MHFKSNTIKIMIGNEIDEFIEERFEFLLQKYEKVLDESMKGSEFVFDSVDLLRYKCHEISQNCSGSCIDSPKSLKNKKARINKNNNNNKCFQCAITVALNHENIVRDHQRIKPFISK